MAAPCPSIMRLSYFGGTLRRALIHRKVALKPFVFKFEASDGNRVRSRIQIRHSLILGNPAAVKVIRQCFLARLVEYIDSDILTELSEVDQTVTGEVVD